MFLWRRPVTVVSYLTVAHMAPVVLIDSFLQNASYFALCAAVLNCDWEVSKLDSAFEIKTFFWNWSTDWMILSSVLWCVCVFHGSVCFVHYGQRNLERILTTGTKKNPLKRMLQRTGVFRSRCCRVYTRTISWTWRPWTWLCTWSSARCCVTSGGLP